MKFRMRNSSGTELHGRRKLFWLAVFPFMMFVAFLIDWRRVSVSFTKKEK